MKLYIFGFAVLIILVQAILTQSLSDNDNLKRMSSAWGKRMSSAWGKRMSSAWGKRGGLDNDDLVNHLLREPYYQARFSKYDYPRYPIDNDIWEQRTLNNNDEDTAPQNLS